jgi:hypothetical protein
MPKTARSDVPDPFALSAMIPSRWSPPGASTDTVSPQLL